MSTQVAATEVARATRVKAACKVHILTQQTCLSARCTLHMARALQESSGDLEDAHMQVVATREVAVTTRVACRVSATCPLCVSTAVTVH